jgi:hypothetical protein
VATQLTVGARLRSLGQVASLLLDPVAGRTVWLDKDIDQPHRYHHLKESFDRIEPFHDKSARKILANVKASCLL